MILTVRNNGWLLPLNSPLSDFFESNEFLSDGSKTRNDLPAVNVFEAEDGYTIEVAAPGMDKDDFSVSVDDGILTISAETVVEEDDRDGEYTFREYDYNSFSRAFTLPQNAMEDGIEAAYENGELIISIPKRIDVVTNGREIEIA